MIELTSFQTIIIAVVIPVLSIGLSVLIGHVSKNRDLGLLNNFGSCGADLVNFESIKSKLIMAYLLIILVLLSNTFAVFYQIVADLAMGLIDPGFVSKTWTKIVIDSPFSGAWYGTLPWYGQKFLPTEGAEIFHETWSWIFFSAGITDDASFFLGATQLVVITTMLLGLLFLIPLGVKSIRESFFTSLYLFNTGMLVTTRGVFGCFSQAWNLEFNNNYLIYGIRIVTGGQLQVTTELSVIATMLVAIFGFYFIFLYIGGKLGRVYFFEKKGAKMMFMLFISLSYWLSLLGIMIAGGQ